MKDKIRQINRGYLVFFFGEKSKFIWQQERENRYFHWWHQSKIEKYFHCYFTISYRIAWNKIRPNTSNLLSQLISLSLINPFPNKPWFLRVCSKSLLKTLREKEKLLVTSNFSSSRSVFYPFDKLSAIFIKFKIVVCKLFQFGRVKNLSFGKGLIR